MNGCTLPLEPLPGQLTLGQPWANLVPDLLMISIHPIPFLLIQKRNINQLPIHRYHRNMLKSIIRTISKLIRCINLLDDNDILNPNTKS